MSLGFGKDSKAGRVGEGRRWVCPDGSLWARKLEASSVKAAVVWLAKVPLWLSLVGPKLEGGGDKNEGSCRLLT